MGPEPKLTEKHIKLLQLAKANKHTYDEMAELAGLQDAYCNDLFVGNPNTGKVGELFAAELKKVDKEVETRISRKTSFVREKLINKLTQWVNACGGGADLDTKTKHKCLVDAINAINKSMPYQVNIENYTWKEGMTTEEAVNEFKRIKALAAAASIRRRVQEFAADGAEQSFVLDGQTDEGSADTQDTVLPAESEAEDVSYKSLSDKGDIRREQVR